MSSSDFCQAEELAGYYDLIYSYKDYKKEVEEICSIIKKFKKSKDNMLMDVACGTAKHLFFLKDYFQCIGVDISSEMLEIARRKIPHMEFIENNMIDMRLEKKFDIITCLFSAIGHIKTHEDLQKTWETFGLHLKQGGVAVIEPWVTQKQYRVNVPNMVTYEDENLKIARLNLAKQAGNLSILEYHYLIAKKNEAVKSFQECHEMGMFEIDETLNIMERAGFEAKFFPEGLMSGRGIYVAIKL